MSSTLLKYDSKYIFGIYIYIYEAHKAETVPSVVIYTL